MDAIIRITQRCNQRCKFCNVVKEFEDVSLDDAKIRIRKLAEDGVQFLSISGGEPTLHKDLSEIISFASSLDSFKSITLQTNAAMLSNEVYVERLVSSGLDAVFVAFHSHLPEVSDGLTLLNGSWGKTVLGIKNALRLGLIVTLNPVINSFNYLELPSYIRFVDEELNGVNSISFSFIQPLGRVEDYPGLVSKMSDVQPYLKEAQDYCYEKKIPFFNPYCGLPLCLSNRYEVFSTEFAQSVSDSSEEEAGKRRVEDMKTKGDSCEGCLLFGKCNGVWKSYGDIHGFGELRPMVSERVVGLLAREELRRKEAEGNEERLQMLGREDVVLKSVVYAEALTMRPFFVKRGFSFDVGNSSGVQLDDCVDVVIKKLS